MYCVIYLVFALMLPMFSAYSKSNPKQEKACKEAETFGKQQNNKNLNAINTFSPNSLISKLEPCQSFDAEEARRNTLNSSPKEGKKHSENKSVDLSINLFNEGSVYPTDLSVFNIDLEGLVAEEFASNSEKLPSIIAKLSIFKEMKKELENSNSADARHVSLFKGEDYKCSRSVLKNALYDCCSSMSGMATAAHLAKCNADEIALHRMREEGKCHYVGEYDKKAMGIKKSEKKVFCCFPSKLSRVIQEQARGQLRLSWGKAKKPECRGLTADEIKRLDFTKLDLLEALPPLSNQADFQSKLSSFQKKVQESNIQSSGE